ncbi:MAG: DUF92 domain-containing protein [archaeon]|nr:DUF92 domain-containing protein [archaeon]MCP8316797.1 DUF92 domain-containing protein [archaeon]MCP8322534.1 DUF92 domain-containing protein [archaeon]
MLPPAIEAMIYLLVVVTLGLMALKAKAVDFGGFIACIFIGYMILLGGGWYWFIVMLVFFAISTQFTKFRYNYKERLGFAQEKGGARGWPNVLANGGVATIFSIMEFRFGGGIYAVAFLGAMASATADTLATEIGLLSKKEPRLITNLKKKVPIGTSGGVTLIGTMASFFASFVIGITAMILKIIDASPIKILIIVTLGGIIGSIIDSILGATIQRTGLCENCKKITESLKHCGKPIKKLKGIMFVDNNVVNFFSTLIGALSTLAFFILI